MKALFSICLSIFSLPSLPVLLFPPYSPVSPHFTSHYSAPLHICLFSPFLSFYHLSPLSSTIFHRFDAHISNFKASGDVRQAVNQLQFWMAGKVLKTGHNTANLESKLSSTDVFATSTIETPATSSSNLTISTSASSYLAYLDLASVEDIYQRSLEGRRLAVFEDMDHYSAHLFKERRLDFGGLHELQPYQGALHGPKLLSARYYSPLEQFLADKGNFEVDGVRLQQSGSSQNTADRVAHCNLANGALAENQLMQKVKNQKDSSVKETFPTNECSPSSLPELPAPTRRSKRLCTAQLSSSSSS